MPIYDFSCLSCGTHFIQKSSLGTQETPCPQCGKTAKKILSPPAVHFSGSGFYQTDHRESTKSPPASSEKPSEKI